MRKPQDSSTVSRRDFLRVATSAAAVASTVTLSAKSYARVVGANDRIRIGIIGCGGRGMGSHFPGIRRYAKAQNAEVIALCDPWRPRLEEGVAMVKEAYGVDAKTFVQAGDLLAMPEVDAVTIASCDHQHTTHLEAAAKAGKDTYCEKPLGKDLEGLKRACDAVKEAGIVVQIGTQLRSMGTFTGCRALYQAGRLGRVTRVEQHRNGSRPYWSGYKKPVLEADVDWKTFLLGAPERPFDADRYSAWMGFRDYSDGPVPQLGVHYLDLVHYITGTGFPVSCTCIGGTYSESGQGYDAPDQVEATWVYPDGFMVSYVSNFGNGAGNVFKIYGDGGTLDMTDWDKPVFANEGLAADKRRSAEKEDVAPVAMPDHMEDWLQCIRSRKTPNAPIEAGFQHSIASIMATLAMDSGQRQVYDAATRSILAG
jgi:predicted dehydrogenase